jgi:uncharacterized protein YprB with RNaseH-like and TPR domain
VTKFQTISTALTPRSSLNIIWRAKRQKFEIRPFNYRFLAMADIVSAHKVNYKLLKQRQCYRTSKTGHKMTEMRREGERKKKNHRHPLTAENSTALFLTLSGFLLFLGGNLNN